MDSFTEIFDTLTEALPSLYTWWDDAVAEANRLALKTGRRRRVVRDDFLGCPMWLVSEVHA